jgi:hypothetical protein
MVLRVWVKRVMQWINYRSQRCCQSLTCHQSWVNNAALVKVVINAILPVPGVFCQWYPLFKGAWSLDSEQCFVFWQNLHYYSGKVIVTCELGGTNFPISVYPGC